MNFGEKMASVRKSKGLSQQDLAKKLKTHATLISRYERNEVKPSIDAAIKIASILDVSLDYLVDGSSNGSPTKDKQTIKRLSEIEKLPEEDRNHLHYLIDSVIRDAKSRQNYSTT